MWPRSPDTDFAGRAVEAEHKAAAATDVQKAERWHRIAASYRHVALCRLPQISNGRVGTDVQDDALYDSRSDHLIRRNHVLIADAAKAFSDIEQSQLKATRARVRARVLRAASHGLDNVMPDRDLAVFGDYAEEC